MLPRDHRAERQREDAAVLRAGGSQHARESARVDVRDGDRAFALQVLRQRQSHAEVRLQHRQVLDDEPRGEHLLALDVLGRHAVVADVRIRERDDLLRVRRQLHGRLEADRALAIDDRLRSGLADGCDRRQCGLVEQDVGAGGAVGLDQHLEFRRRRTALHRHLEIDLDQHRGATDAHGRDRRVDLHVAFLGGGAGDERDRASHQAEQRFVVRPVGVVDHFVQHHLGVRREAEHGAVDEGDAERRIGTGLDDVALMDGVTLVQDDRHAVADRGRVARQLGDMADDRRRDAGAAVGLRELGVPGQRVDDVAGEVGAIRRGQRGAFLALEVIGQHDLAVAAGEDQVDARPLEVSVEQQMGIRNNYGVGRRMCRNLVDMELAGRRKMAML